MAKVTGCACSHHKQTLGTSSNCRLSHSANKLYLTVQLLKCAHVYLVGTQCVLLVGNKALVVNSSSDDFSSAIWLAIHLYRRQCNKGQALDLT